MSAGATDSCELGKAQLVLQMRLNVVEDAAKPIAGKTSRARSGDRHAVGQPREPGARGHAQGANCHVVKIVLRKTNCRCSVSGRAVEDGVAMAGMVHVTEPAASTRCLFRGSYDTLHLHVPNDLIAECGREVPGDPTLVLPSKSALTPEPLVERLGRALLGADGLDFAPLYADSTSIAIVARLMTRLPQVDHFLGYTYLDNLIITGLPAPRPLLYLFRHNKYNPAAMADKVSLTAQTAYAELVDRCTTAAFEAEFPLNGSFVRVPVKDRVYWYFQEGARDASGKQPRKYVGPDTPEIQQRIASHGQAKDDYKQRRHLAATLRREGFQSPLENAGRVLQVLSAAGIFRLRACIVGTAAYQVYGPMLGVRLPHATLQTGDLDIAQFTSISVAISEDEQTPPLLDILQQADPSFRPVPHIKAEATTSYINDEGFRVEVLTENRGPEGDTPRQLPALGTHAQPLRFLDFLIYDEIPAIVLYNGGVLVNVPSPARYTLHKLIVAQRRKEGAAKIDKDIQQAGSLLSVLAQRRPNDLRDAWSEAIGRGKTWAELLARGLAQVSPRIRDQALHVFGATRSILPGQDIRFSDAPPRYDFSREAVVFQGDAGGERVLCAISREALEDHFEADGLTPKKRMEVFRQHRDEIQSMARLIYLDRVVPQDGAVLVTTADVESLRHQLKLKARAAKRKG
jgi:hypothetical protein